jgi:AcrR family transcriptional regulator
LRATPSRPKLHAMSEPDFQRARTPERKAERRAAILFAAGDLLDAGGPSAATLSAIAAKAGVVKSGLYRYFESREDILIQLMLAGIEGVVTAAEADAAALAARGAAPGYPGRVARAAALVAACFAGRPRVCLLIAEMAPTLERNISVPGIVALKLRMLPLIARAGGAIALAHGALPPTAAALAANALPPLVAGLWPMANPGPAVAEALRDPRLAGFDQPFETSLRAAFHAVLLGAEAAAQPWAKSQ